MSNKRTISDVDNTENSADVGGIDALMQAVITVSETPIEKKTKRELPQTPEALITQVTAIAPRLERYQTWYNEWFEKTFKMDEPVQTDGLAYAASQNIFHAFIVNNYVKNHLENTAAQGWGSGMALNNAIKANYGTLIEFAAQKAYNASTWGAVMNQLSSYMQTVKEFASYEDVMSKLKTWATQNKMAAQDFFQTNLGGLIKLSMKRLAIGASTLGVAYYFPSTVYGILYYMADLSVKLGIYGSIGAAIVAVGAVIDKYYNKGKNTLAGIDIVGGSENILTMLNDPQGEEAEQMRTYLTSFVSPRLDKLQADWNTKMKEQSKTPETNFEELIQNSHVAMVNENTDRTKQNQANEISKIWWDAYRRELLKNNGRYDSIEAAKSAADKEVNAFKTALGGVRAAGGGRNTKRKRQSKKTKAKKSHKKSHKKRDTKSKKHHKTK